MRPPPGLRRGTGRPLQPGRKILCPLPKRGRMGTRTGEPRESLRTLLRATYERTRALPREAQLQECVDHLGHPEVLVSEFVDAYCAVEAMADMAPVQVALAGPDGDPAELVLEYFYEGREISIGGIDSSDFRCVASDVLPLAGMQPGGDERDGLDYVGLADKDAPVLGAVQSERDSTPLLVLLRLLTCTAELSPAPQLERLDREFLGGTLGSEPVFDLHLVLWEGEAESQPSLHELTRDLAEVVKQAALDDPQFPPVLGSICGLRMDPDAFAGRLRLDWRV